MKNHSFPAVALLTATFLPLTIGKTVQADTSPSQKVPTKVAVASGGKAASQKASPRLALNEKNIRTVADTAEPEVRVLTMADGNSQITLNPGETFVVHLPDMGSTGSVWSLVDIPGMPVRLESQQRTRGKAAPGVVGAPGIHEWKFVGTAAKFGRTSYLKLLQLRPFEAGIATARLWEVKVFVPASP